MLGVIGLELKHHKGNIMKPNVLVHTQVKKEDRGIKCVRVFVCVRVCVCSRIKIIKMGAVCCCAIKVMIGFKRSYEQKQVQDTQCSQYFTMFSFTIVIVKTLRKYKKIVNNNSKSQYQYQFFT